MKNLMLLRAIQVRGIFEALNANQNPENLRLFTGQNDLSPSLQPNVRLSAYEFIQWVSAGQQNPSVASDRTVAATYLPLGSKAGPEITKNRTETIRLPVARLEQGT